MNLAITTTINATLEEFLILYLYFQLTNIVDDLPGFSVPDGLQGNDDGCPFRKVRGKSGGFQAMGLSFPVLKGITKRGYKVPTPIQRKTIPLILEGRDVVAMAKTGTERMNCSDFYGGDKY